MYEQPSAKPQGNYKSKLLQRNHYYSNLFKYVIILLELEFKKQNKFIAILCNLGVSLYDDYFFLNALILKVERGAFKMFRGIFFPRFVLTPFAYFTTQGICRWSHSQVFRGEGEDGTAQPSAGCGRGPAGRGNNAHCADICRKVSSDWLLQ